MAAVRLGFGLTDLFAVVGSDALTRLRRLGEDVLADRLVRRLHDMKELRRAGGPSRQAREDRLFLSTLTTLLAGSLAFFQTYPKSPFGSPVVAGLRAPSSAVLVNI